MKIVVCLLTLILVFTSMQKLPTSQQLSLTNPKELTAKTAIPEENKTYPVGIIGSGAAGTMAVKRVVLNNQEALLFMGAKQERRRARGSWVRTVDNVPGLEKYSRALLELRNETLEGLVEHPLGSNLFIIEDSVVEIKKEEDRFKLVDGQGRAFYTKYVILATGMMDEQPHIQGSISPILKHANRQSVAYCLTCDGHRSVGKKTVVIGYSEEAANIALILSDKYALKELSILTNGHAPQFSPETIEKLNKREIYIFEEPIFEILANDSKQLLGFKLENGQEVNAEMGFVALGIRPNNELAVQLGAEMDEKGLVITYDKGETSIPGLFVAGDLRSGSMKQIYTAWQHAVESAQEINKRIRQENN